MRIVDSSPIDVGIVDVHQVRPSYGNPGSLHRVHLDRNIRNVFVLALVVDLTSMRWNPCPLRLRTSTLVLIPRKVNAGSYRAGTESSDNRAWVDLSAWECSKYCSSMRGAIGKSQPGQLANGGPGIEDCLLARFDRVGKLAVVTVEVEPFHALKAGEKPGLG